MNNGTLRCTYCLLVALPALFSVVTATSLPYENEVSEKNTVQVEMKNVMYHYTPLVSVHIVSLQGHLTPTKAGEIVIFDDKNSFTLALSSAEIGITCKSLAQVLNQNVFSTENTPLKNISIETKADQLVIKGKLHQKGDIPFEVTGILSAGNDGRIRLHADHIKAAHLPMKGLLDLLGLDLSRLINTQKVAGVTVEKDDVILDPEQILPPPHIKGRVTSVRIQGQEVVQVFGTPQPVGFAANQSGNYMAYRNNELQFGKLTMHAADLIMIDMDPRDPFDFYLDRYKDQLVAGYTKITPEFGLRVYTRDFNKLPRSKDETTPHKRRRAASIVE
jgi:hypothetical protein